MKVQVTQLCGTLQPHGLYGPWNSTGQNTGVGNSLTNPGIKPRSPTLQMDFLSAEPQGKPKNPGVGSLSLLQGIFPTQKIEPESPALQADSLPAEVLGKL